MRYENLDAEKARRGVTNAMFAEAIGKSVETIDKKMSGKVDWKINEVLAIKRKFFPNDTLDYLFASEERDDE